MSTLQLFLSSPCLHALLNILISTNTSLHNYQRLEKKHFHMCVCVCVCQYVFCVCM